MLLAADSVPPMHSPLVETIEQADGMIGGTPPKRQTKEEVRAAQRKWVKQLMQKSGHTLSAIAATAGFPVSTLTRFYNRPGYDGTLQQTTVQRISDAYGVPGPGVTVPLSGSAAPVDECEQFDASDAPDVRALMQGRPATHAVIMNVDVLASVGVLTGDVLIVDPEETPREGDMVLAAIEGARISGHVVRLYYPPHLVADPRSTRPDLVDGKRVRIAGVVTHVLRARVA